jgi:hypothetical protein
MAMTTLENIKDSSKLFFTKMVSFNFEFLNLYYFKSNLLINIFLTLIQLQCLIFYEIHA